MSKINWERSRPTNRVIGEYSEASFNTTMEIESSKPTVKQKRYFKRLIILCKERGETPKVMKHIRTRGEYASAITALTRQLGIEDKRKGEFVAVGDGIYRVDKPKKSESTGCPNCIHNIKSKNLFPCNGCFNMSKFSEGV